MRNEVIWAIRDARGLTIYEAMLIFVVESRGTCAATRERMQADMKCGKDSFYAARKSLSAKGILGFERKYDDVTSYWINADVLMEYIQDSVTQNDSDQDSVRQNGDSVRQNEDSVRQETKKNVKKNSKKNIENKKNIPPVVADAPTAVVQPRLTKEEVEDTYLSSLIDTPPACLNLEETHTDFDTITHARREPTFGTMHDLGDGHVIFATTDSTGGPRYLLCNSGVTGPLTEPQSAEPVCGETPEPVERQESDSPALPCAKFAGIPVLHDRYHNGERCPALQRA